MASGDLNSGPCATQQHFTDSAVFSVLNRYGLIILLFCFLLLVGDSLYVEIVSSVHVRVYSRVWWLQGAGSEDDLQESVFSFHDWISGIELGSSGLVADSLLGSVFIYYGWCSLEFSLIFRRHQLCLLCPEGQQEAMEHPRLGLGTRGPEAWLCL